MLSNINKYYQQLSDVIDRQQNLERTNLKLREGTDEVRHFSRYLQMRYIYPKIDTYNSKIILVDTCMILRLVD